MSILAQALVVGALLTTVAPIATARTDDSTLLAQRSKKRRDRANEPAPTPASPPPSAADEPEASSERPWVGQCLFGGVMMVALIGGLVLWLSLRRKKAGGARSAWASLAQQLGWQFVPGAGTDVGTLRGMAGGFTIEASAGFTSNARTGSFPYTQVRTTLPRPLRADFSVSQAKLLTRGKTGDAAMDEQAVVEGPDSQRLLASPTRDALLGYAAAVQWFSSFRAPNAQLASTNDVIMTNPAELRAIIDAHVALATALQQTFPG